MDVGIRGPRIAPGGRTSIELLAGCGSDLWWAASNFVLEDSSAPVWAGMVDSGFKNVV